MRAAWLSCLLLTAGRATAAEPEPPPPSIEGLYLEDAPRVAGKPSVYQIARRAGASGRYWILAGSDTLLFDAEAKRDRGGRVQLALRPAVAAQRPPALSLYPSAEGKRDLVETDAQGKRTSFSRLIDPRIARALGELRGGRKLLLYPPDKRAAGDSVTVEDTFIVTTRMTDKSTQRCLRGALVPMPAELAQRMARGLPFTKKAFALPFMIVGVRGGGGCDGPLLDEKKATRPDDLQFGATLFLDGEGAVAGVHLFAYMVSAAYLVEGRPADDLARQIQAVSDEETGRAAE